MRGGIRSSPVSGLLLDNYSNLYGMTNSIIEIRPTPHPHPPSQSAAAALLLCVRQYVHERGNGCTRYGLTNIRNEPQGFS